jgi:mono/diheme cytochrome c family protein
MIVRSTALTATLLLAGFAIAGRAETPPLKQSQPAVDFDKDVRPIFEQHCYECHGPKKSRGRLRLDSRASGLKGGVSGPPLVPGEADRSLIVRRVLGLDGEDRMPLDKDPLPDAQIATLRTWIAQGASWPGDAAPTPDATSTQTTAAGTPEHWSYIAPRTPTPPTVTTPNWVRNPIDQFVLARLEKEGLQPSHEASREALLRRVSLDLIGLPPTPAETDAFLADSAPDAYERVVDRLLASPHYGERWARPWLDLARYADSNGYEKDALRTMWKYRDWVIKALNDDMPFDRFTIEQLAGDMLPNATSDQLIASGFHRNTLLNQEGGIDVEEARWETLVDRVNTTSTVWLGSTIACAQCHNHKYDPFSQRDYYRLLAFFDNVEYSVFGKPGGDHWINEATLDLPTPEQETRRATLAAELKTLEARLNDPDEKIDAAYPAWEQAMRETDAMWTTVQPDKAHADAATLTVQSDGSVIASGTHPGVDRYQVEGPVKDGLVTGIRLEAIPDGSLPQGGPGRDAYGNFVVTGFKVELISTDGKATPVTFADAVADDWANGKVTDLIKMTAASRNDDLPPGWTIDATRDRQRLRRQAVFVPGAPIDVPTGTRLRLTLAFNGANVGQALGRFCVSFTTNAAPLTAVSIPARVRDFLTIDPKERSPEQQKAVRSQYREQCPELAPVRDRIAAVKKELRDLGIISALVMKEKQSYERPSTPFRERGAYLAPGERVFARTPAVLPRMTEDEMPNRLGLARWLVNPANPLTARVTVNRAWEQFFGRGIVETSEDFGTQGAAPSHPELLDWLATDLVRLQWSQKALHRLIVTSAAYRQDAQATPALQSRDPNNRLIARGPRFRMEAEMVRDVTLTAAGLLSEKIGGPSVFPDQPEGIWDNPYSDEKWVTSQGEDRYRRGLYTFVRRTSPYPSFMTFDATSRESCTVRRVRTNTPLQALTLLNDEVSMEAARALVDRVEREIAPTIPAGSAPNNRERAALAFRLCTSRRPTEHEIDLVVQSFERQRRHYRGRPADAAKVMAVTATGRDARLADRAAWTLVANSLLNLDETVTK